MFKYPIQIKFIMKVMSK